ncbi:MAG: hypothetical protein QW374_04975 [Candidatus Bathyarchaeia archaeon]|nr:hypothetical protein [Candidatus Bathyarchaeota archaeon]
MIRIVQVDAKAGRIILRIQADFPDQTTRIIEVDYGDVEDRLRRIRELIGREPTEQDFVDVVKALVNEVRTARKPIRKQFSLDKFIDIDLECEEM